MVSEESLNLRDNENKFFKEKVKRRTEKCKGVYLFSDRALRNLPVPITPSIDNGAPLMLMLSLKFKLYLETLKSAVVKPLA